MTRPALAVPLALFAAALLAEPTRASDEAATLAALPPLEVFQPVSATAGDVDGDGHVDLLVRSAFLPFLDEVLLLRGRGDGSFAEPETVLSLGGSSANVLALELHDVDADGDLDLLALPADVRMGDGRGGFGPPIPMGWQALLDPSVVRPTTGDVDGDGLVDVVLYGYKLGEPFSQGGTPKLLTLLSDGEGGLEPPPGASLVESDGGYPNVLIDVDHDGNLDVVATEFGSLTTLLVQRGLGDGLFQPGTPVGLLPGLPRTALAAGDLDDDGWSDVVTAHVDVDTGTVSLWANRGGPTGDLTLQPGLDLPPGSEPRYQLVLADVTGDGPLDVVSAAGLAADTLHLAVGDGAGALTDAGAYLDDWHGHLTAADVDGDPAVEVVAVNTFSLTGEAYVVHGAPDAFVDVGLGAGQLTLGGSGSTTPEQAVELQLQGSTATLAAFVVSLDANLVALPVGTLVPDPLGALGALVVAPAAEPLRFRWPQLPAGTQVHAQALAFGELSNALVMVAR